LARNSLCIGERFHNQGDEIMVNQSVLQGNWKQIKGKLREKWGALADDDVATFNGNVDQLVGKIQQKTGETRQAVERFLEEVSDGGTSLAGRAGEAVQHAGAYVRDAAGHVRDSMGEGYAAAEEFVQDRPATSMAFAFGCGVAVGLGLALLFRERPAPSTWSRGRDMAEKIGCQVRDAVAAAIPERFRS
jgi:uncharacterized protein YjbJ (UPF0337 family)